MKGGVARAEVERFLKDGLQEARELSNTSPVFSIVFLSHCAQARNIWQDMFAFWDIHVSHMGEGWMDRFQQSSSQDSLIEFAYQSMCNSGYHAACHTRADSAYNHNRQPLTRYT